jgi:hypothetical protein
MEIERVLGFLAFLTGITGFTIGVYNVTDYVTTHVGAAAVSLIETVGGLVIGYLGLKKYREGTLF